MANANLYIQAWSEQKGLATFFSPKRGKLGKILTSLVDKAYGGFTVVQAGDLTSGRAFFYNVYLSCLDTRAEGWEVAARFRQYEKTGSDPSV